MLSLQRARRCSPRKRNNTPPARNASPTNTSGIVPLPVNGSDPDPPDGVTVVGVVPPGTVVVDEPATVEPSVATVVVVVPSGIVVDVAPSTVVVVVGASVVVVVEPRSPIVVVVVGA